MSLKRLVETYERWRGDDRAMVLATVVRTEGSTYSKPGHRILIDADANYQGLVSGGCLEGDLAEHALSVIDEREARTVIYDMRGENDELFGLGVGCDGLLEILLQPLDPANDYAPFPDLVSALLGDTACTICVVIAGDNDTPPAGATCLLYTSPSPRDATLSRMPSSA